MKSKHCFAGLIVGVWLISVSLAGADIIFQADFKGDQGGTGGPADLVTLGGTGTLKSNSSASGLVSSSGSVLKDTPLGKGPYLHYSLNREEDSTTGPGGGTPVAFTPSTLANSWESLATVSKGHVLINGAADFFVRINKATNMTMQWFRPLDFGDANTQLRIDVSTADDNGQQDIQLEVLGPDGALTGTKRISIPSPLVVGGLYHFAISFSSTPDGNVTMTLYVSFGLGAIDSVVMGNSAVTATGVFQVDASKIQRPDILPNDTFTFGGGWFKTQSATLDADYACFRIYNSVPKTFEALPTATTHTP